MRDESGDVVGVVVTREPEWDETQREAMLALVEYEAGVHSDGCGYHTSVANDPTRYYTLDSEHCLLCANLAREQRQQDEADRLEHERLKDNPRARRKSDGRRRFLRPMTDDEVEAALAARNPSSKEVPRGGSS